MVPAVEVETCPSDTSMISIRVEPPEDFMMDFGVAGGETSFTGRDTSNAERGSMENTRQEDSRLVNTHNLILNITDEEEEEEEIEQAEHSFLFEDMLENPLDHSLLAAEPSSPRRTSAQQPPPTPPFRQKCCESLNLGTSPTTEVAVQDNSLFDLTERFMDSICFGNEKDLAEPSKEDKVRRNLEVDLFELLGCASSPDDEEMEQVWANSFLCATKHNVIQTPKRRVPQRATLRERVKRIHRLKTERKLPQKRTGLSPTTVIIDRSRSLGDVPRKQLFELEQKLGHIDPISSDDLGYDSDPELSFVDSEPAPAVLPVTTPMPCHLDRNIEENNGSEIPYSDSDALQVVQDSFNITWTLTWHRPIVNTATHASVQPMCCNVWMERGTMVHNNTVMLEPNLMWRQAYQPNLDHHKLNPSSQRPFSLRVLNMCRILTEFDRAKYPLARPSCSILVKTADEGDFLFEAATKKERDDLVRRWKLSVARFATLAIMEDMNSICKEFFSPLVTKQTMLLPDYQV